MLICKPHIVVPGSTKMVRRSSGLSGPGHTRRVPLSAAPGGLVFLRAPQQLAGQLVGVRARVQVDLGRPTTGCSRPITRISPRSPAWSRLGGSSGRTPRVSGSRRTDEAAPSAFSHLAGDPHQLTHLLTGRSQTRSPDCRRWPAEDHHTTDVVATQVRTQQLEVGRGVTSSDQRSAVHSVPCAPSDFRRVGQRGRQEVVGVGGVEQQPRPSVAARHCGQSRCCQSMVSSRSAINLSRAPLSEVASDPQPTHGQQHRPVLVEYVEVGFAPVARSEGVRHPA